MSRDRWAAVVGSELQLLSLIEAHALGLLGDGGTDVLIAGSYRPHGDLVASLAHRGIDCELLTTPRLAAVVLRRRVAFGDPFGRAAHLRMAMGRLDSMIVLEDGLATLTAISQTALQRPFARPRLARPPRFNIVAAPLAARARDGMASRGDLHWVLGAATADVLRRDGIRVSGHVHEHHFDALRALPPPEVTTDRTVRRLVVGSSYAANGLIETDFYRSWLRAVCSIEPEHTLVVPHPRDLPDTRTLALDTGAAVGASPASVERIALAMDDLVSIHCLPSSPVLSLSTLGYGDRLHVAAIGDPDWCAGVPSAFRELAHLATPAHPIDPVPDPQLN